MGLLCPTKHLPVGRVVVVAVFSAIFDISLAFERIGKKSGHNTKRFSFRRHTNGHISVSVCKRAVEGGCIYFACMQKRMTAQASSRRLSRYNCPFVSVTFSRVQRVCVSIYVREGRTPATECGHDTCPLN